MNILDKALDAVGLQRKPKPEDDQMINRIYGLFEEYRAAYTPEWERLDRNEKFYLGKHWDLIEQQDPNEPRPVTPILHSSVENVKADIMRAFPEAVITPERSEDEQVAKVLNEIIKQNHDAANYRKEYKRAAHDLLVAGYCVQETGYNPQENNGIGGAFIRFVDAHNIMVDPQCSDIQDGRAVIKFESRTVKWMEQQYPHLKGQFKTDEYEAKHDDYVTYDQTKSVMMLEYWWREYDAEGQRFKVHMIKAAGRHILEDSREQKPDGYYAHGKYPFHVTPLFERKGSALGYGLVDVLWQLQLYADKCDQIVMKNALMASHNKMLITSSSGFDVDDLRDWSKEVHQGESLNGVTWFSTPPLPAYILQYIQSMRENVKEESGANDFSRGSTNSGVTAASAIAALQEEAAKRSAMAIDQLHETFKELVRMEIEVEREFAIVPREVNLKENGQAYIEKFSASMMKRQGAKGMMIPIEFSVSIKVQTETTWNKMAHNELVLQMVQLGVIRPDQSLEIMYFDGKESILQKVAENQQQQVDPQAQMVQELQQMPMPEMAVQ